MIRQVMRSIPFLFLAAAAIGFLWVGASTPSPAGPQESSGEWEGVPSSAYLSLLPDGETKRRFILDCAGCHPFDRTIVVRADSLAAETPTGLATGTEAGGLFVPKTEAEWAGHIERMLSFAGAQSSFPIMSASRDAGETAAWLASALSDGGSEDGPALPGTVGDPSRAVITEYDLPEAGDLPHDLMVDPDGRIVITGMMTQQMYLLDPETGGFETTPIPVGGGARALDIDESGVWYVLLGGPPSVARYDPATGDWSSWETGMYPHSTVLDGAGRVWFNGHFTREPEQLGYVDPASGEVRLYDVPADPMSDGGSTIQYGLRAGPDGVIWTTQLAGNHLIRLEPESGEFRLYELPTSHSGPRRPDIAPDGVVWIPEFAANKLARFDPVTETFKEFDFPIADALPYVVRVDPVRGTVWIGTAAADVVASFDPDTETFTVYPLPTRGALTRHIDIDPESGDVWAAYGPWPPRGAKVARLRLP